MSTQVAGVHYHHHDIEEAARRRTSNLQAPGTSQDGGMMPPNHHHIISAVAGIDLLAGSSGVAPERAPPSSRGTAGLFLPLNTKQLQQPHQQSSNATGDSSAEIRLLHPFLNRVPLQFRFGFNGLLSNGLFMVAYNSSVLHFSHHGYKASTIYSIVYLLFIPISHVMVSLLVFGWPTRYLPSLLSNFPIGLTALAIGSLLTSYLDALDFNYRIEEYIRDNYSFSKMPARTPTDDRDEFYSSIVVLAVTSLWTYALSVYINAPPALSEKKQL
jgi:hypothetical protein